VVVVVTMLCFKVSSTSTFTIIYKQAVTVWTEFIVNTNLKVLMAPYLLKRKNLYITKILSQISKL